MTCDWVRLGVGGPGEEARTAGRGLLVGLPVSVGRAPGSALRVEHPWMPRRLMSLEPDGHRWALVNGDRTRCRVTSEGLEMVLAPGRRMVLGPGEWRLRWPELDNRVDVRVELESPHPADGEWPPLADRTDDMGHPRALASTHAAGDDLAAVLTPLRRYRLAVLFRHEFEGRQSPDPFFPPAVEETGCSMQVLKNLVKDTKCQLNRQRGLELTSNDSLGYYLVHTTGVIRTEHLRPPGADGLPE